MGKLQFRFVPSLTVFIGSYFPLSLILLAQDYRYDLLWAPFCWPPGTGNCVVPLQNGTLSLIVFVLCLFCLVFSLGALATVKPKTPVDIKEAKYIPAELMAYTLPYVVSFMSLEYKDTGKFVGLLIFLGWMFIITYRSGQLILNPLLIVFGWRLYEVTLSYPGKNAVNITSWALSKADLQPGTRCNVASIQDIRIIRLTTAEGAADAST
ncbi:hypothetical protein [Rhizobium leguminosarum]|uniref:hypothetical protein n=1 Tax=Rhizobium leguminosarum TaxID=384 RepID=UPI0015FD85B9|nr:hypothetical protein [Rhizobium leguminosarum]MBA9030941.1 hypothetical protein [Rhizobium leguminosarum]